MTLLHADVVCLPSISRLNSCFNVLNMNVQRFGLRMFDRELRYVLDVVNSLPWTISCHPVPKAHVKCGLESGAGCFGL